MSKHIDLNPQNINIHILNALEMLIPKKIAVKNCNLRLNFAEEIRGYTSLNGYCSKYGSLIRIHFGIEIRKNELSFWYENTKLNKMFMFGEIT